MAHTIRPRYGHLGPHITIGSVFNTHIQPYDAIPQHLEPEPQAFVGDQDLEILPAQSISSSLMLSRGPPGALLQLYSICCVLSRGSGPINATKRSKDRTCGSGVHTVVLCVLWLAKPKFGVHVAACSINTPLCPTTSTNCQVLSPMTLQNLSKEVILSTSNRFQSSL